MKNFETLIQELCPDGVEFVKLVKYVNVQYGFAFDSKLFTDDEQYIPLIRIRDVVPAKPSTYYSGEYCSDYIIRKGDILFYRRKNGKCVLHRVKKITDHGLYFIGDSQNTIEGPLDKSCVLAKCNSVIRKGKLIDNKSIIWKFFRDIWLNIIPLRLPLIKFIAKIKKLK